MMKPVSGTQTKVKLNWLWFLVVVCLFMTTALAACSSVADSSPASTIALSQEPSYAPTLPNESAYSGTLYTTVLEEFSVVNSDGNTIYGMIRRPDPNLHPLLSFAAVFMVPGGINSGRMQVLSPEAIVLAEAGMVVVCFNAEGRVDDRTPDDIASEGVENYNGFRNQDTLAEIIQLLLQKPYVMQDNIGIRSQSYGISMAAGCAARHPELPIKYIVDGEGPPSSFVTVQEPWAQYSPPDHPHHHKYQTVHDILGHYSTDRDPSPENEAFWSERDAIAFIGEFEGMYLRLQAEWDHSQPPSRPVEIEMFHQPPTWWHGKHTCDMVNAAVDGGVPWVWVNLPAQGNRVNEIYSADKLPVYIPGELNSNPLIPAQAVLEMARTESVRP